MGAAAVVVRDRGAAMVPPSSWPAGIARSHLRIGALCALLAVGVQGMMGAPALRKLTAMGDSDELRPSRGEEPARCCSPVGNHRHVHGSGTLRLMRPRDGHSPRLRSFT